MDPDSIAPMLVGLAFALLVGTAIGGIILRAAVSLFNTIIGGAKSAGAVKEPSLLKAMGIILLTLIVNSAANFGIGFMLGAAGVAAKLGERQLLVAAQLASLPISIIIMAAMLSVLLPTTFLRALLISFFNLLISVAIIAGIGLVVLIVSFVFMR